MIIVPEIETVLILVPRAASRSLRRAVEARYPKAMTIYRHMEADGVPAGYDRWPRLGVVRHPVDRLWSLYKFLQRFDGDYVQEYVERQRRSVAMPFNDWLLTNEVVFTSPYSTIDGERYWPFFNVLHSLPENRKSQFMYLRPDLGTTIYRFEDLQTLGAHLDIDLPHTHETGAERVPALSDEAWNHIERFFAWDLKAVEGPEQLVAWRAERGEPTP